jgi:hypothetical protein
MMKITIEHFIFGLLGKVTNNGYENFKGDDENDDDANFENENALKCGSFSGKYPDEPAERVLNFLECEENDPAVDKDTEMHDDFVVSRVKLYDLRFGNGSSIPNNYFNSFDQVLQNQVSQTQQWR